MKIMNGKLDKLNSIIKWRCKNWFFTKYLDNTKFH